ncbi:threonine synthase [Desulfurispora thermophila]|uniref:threonine synthase n=1 Tax=Desulfurispora thermophila TaxID=265470 RepID=UPI00036B0C71|nr:threonine synthase [Desulfurispora thermophila]
MQYASTRGGYGPVSAAQAIEAGIAPDGGLFVPLQEVKLDDFLAWRELDYAGRARQVLRAYLTDFTEEELAHCASNAYSDRNFDHPQVAPVVELAEDLFVLELWHGPTSAFKDMALQILPYFLPLARRKNGGDQEIVILVATSGDTGKAALEGFKDVPGTRILVFFPNQGVSEVQRLQMVTQAGGNVGVVAVQGNFDDAQGGVKAIFTDPQLRAELARAGFVFSSANSINWGRLVPQIVYYFSAYLDLVQKGRLVAGAPVNFVVPTGNFGNILAGYYARAAGLPVHKLICAANSNNVLTDFVRSGTYDRRRPFYKTLSPSMDILVSSNLERLLYHLSDGDSAAVATWMGSLQREGLYSVSAGVQEKVCRLFWSDYADDQRTLDTIARAYRQYGYVLDTHTAVGLAVYENYRRETGDPTPTVLLSTASPFKFNASVARALLGEVAVQGRSEFALLELLSRHTGLAVPAGLRDLDKKPVRHKRVVEKSQMVLAVREFLGLA